jgi:hypothetical protein
MLWLVAAAHAEPDRAISTVGASGLYAHALGEVEAQVLVGERVDWGLGGDWRAGLDGRVTLGVLDDPLLQWLRLSEANVERREGGVALTIGRSPVTFGGPRLVDGVQLVAARDAWRLGAWAGLAPDLFTTLPALRFGGGPIVGWVGDELQASVVGEVLAVDRGLDRLALLAQARHEASDALDLSSRLDVQVASTTGGFGVSDAWIGAYVDPTEHIDLDAFLETYSSLRYLESADLDPWVRRFLERTVDLGIAEGVSAELVDPTQYYLGGASFDVRGSADTALTAGVSVRARLHQDALQRFARVSPRVGVSGLRGGALDVVLDANVIVLDVGTQGDVGITATLAPRDDAWVWDASVRGLYTARDGEAARPGWYADAYVSRFVRARGRGLAVVAGLYAEGLADQEFFDQAEGGFVRLTVEARRETDD